PQDAQHGFHPPGTRRTGRAGRRIRVHRRTYPDRDAVCADAGSALCRVRLPADLSRFDDARFGARDRVMWDRIFTPEYWAQEGRLIATHAGEAAVGILWALLLLGVGRLLLLRAIDAALRPVVSHRDHRTPEGRASRTKTLAGLLKSIANYTLVF